VSEPRKPRSISKKTRFEVFKRDSFTCQYCGAKAPDVLLRLDHINPVAKGGTSSVLNLITACHSCNAGKSDRELSDSTVVSKAHEQAHQLQERREQIKMLGNWHEELANLEEESVDAVCDLFAILAGGFTWRSPESRNRIKKLISSYGLSEVLTAIRISVQTYLTWTKDGAVDPESVEIASQKLSGILFNRKKYSGPHGEAIQYALNITKQHHYVSLPKLRTIESLCRKALVAISPSELVALARDSEDPNHFIAQLEDIVL